jgi:NaMN:DMB phosphoribosyltransferase
VWQRENRDWGMYSKQKEILESLKKGEIIMVEEMGMGNTSSAACPT